MFFDNKVVAQGTIEYLVIIAVVVVISLVVVGLFVNMTGSPSQEIIDSSNKLGTSSSGGISVVEAVIDSAGDSLIKLNNNSSDAITLTRISVGGVDNSFSEQLLGLDSKVISLSGLSSGCVCASGQKNVKCEYVITYIQNGITKTDRLTKTIECVNDSTPVDSGKVVGLGSGTLLDPWVINNCQELQNMNQHLDGNYILGADINCYNDTRVGGVLYNGGYGFSPVGYPTYFTGRLNGNNKTISGLFVFNSYLTGLFAHIGTFGVVENLVLSAPNITQAMQAQYHSCAGGIAAANEGLINNVNVIGGTVTAYCFANGISPIADLVAEGMGEYAEDYCEFSSGDITNSQSTATISPTIPPYYCDPA